MRKLFTALVAAVGVLGLAGSAIAGGGGGCGGVTESADADSLITADSSTTSGPISTAQPAQPKTEPEG